VRRGFVFFASFFGQKQFLGVLIKPNEFTELIVLERKRFVFVFIAFFNFLNRLVFLKFIFKFSFFVELVFFLELVLFLEFVFFLVILEFLLFGSSH
jgi:hypothetical protein